MATERCKFTGEGRVVWATAVRAAHVTAKVTARHASIRLPIVPLIAPPRQKALTLNFEFLYIDDSPISTRNQEKIAAGGDKEYNASNARAKSYSRKRNRFFENQQRKVNMNRTASRMLLISAACILAFAIAVPGGFAQNAAQPA